MNLVSDMMKAVPFGLESSAQVNAESIAADLTAAGVGASPLERLTGSTPVLDVVPLPDDTPYGPWWVIRVRVGAETRYIAN